MSDLYREVIIDHYKNPRNKGKHEDAHMHAKEDNVVCGDTVEFFISFDSSGKAEHVHWEGQGCALSQASASLLSEMMKGKTKEELKKISEHDILTVVGEDLHPSRKKCATLSLVALSRALEEK